MLLEPVREQLLADEAVDLAVSMIRKWARSERAELTRPAELDDLDRRIARLEAQVATGALERQDIGPSLAALFDRRRAVLANSRRGAKAASSFNYETAAAAYRAAAQNPRESLQGPAGRARAALRDILGDVVCRPENGVLVAQVGINAAPLLKAAGVSWNGSGGALFFYDTRRLARIAKR